MGASARPRVLVAILACQRPPLLVCQLQALATCATPPIVCRPIYFRVTTLGLSYDPDGVEVTSKVLGKVERRYNSFDELASKLQNGEVGIDAQGLLRLPSK